MSDEELRGWVFQPERVSSREIVDDAVMGEGEEAVLALADVLQHGRKLEELEGRALNGKGRRPVASALSRGVALTRRSSRAYLLSRAR